MRRVRVRCARSDVVAHAELGVAQRHRDDAPLVAALGDAHLDRRAAALAEEARDQVGVGDLACGTQISGGMPTCVS